MTESTSVDQRDSRVTSDPASFDRFAELVDAGKVPKSDLTTCIGDARPSIQNMKPS